MSTSKDLYAWSSLCWKQSWFVNLMTRKNWISFKIKQIQSFFKYGKCLQKACQLFNILQQTLAPRLVHELIHREKQNKLLQLCGKKNHYIKLWRYLEGSFEISQRNLARAKSLHSCLVTPKIQISCLIFTYNNTL